MADTASELIRDVLTPVPDNLRAHFAPLFSSTDLGSIDAALASAFPDATRRRRSLPASLADFAWESADADALRRAVDAFVAQYAAGVKQVHNADLRFDVYLPSCFYSRLARAVEGDQAVDDRALSKNLSEALGGAGYPDVSYTDTQLFFPVALGERWALVHVSYIEDRITLFDPAAGTGGIAEGEAVLNVVRDHITAADRVHFDKTHVLSTHVMRVAVPVPANISALVVCAALEVFPSRHCRDAECPAFDKVIEAVKADTPVYDLLDSTDDPVVLQLGRSPAAPKVTVEKAGRGLRAELLDRVRCTWATGVPVNAESISRLVKD